MTSSDSPETAPVRRSRRAVRHAGTVGGDEANLVSTHPALEADTPRPHAAVGDSSRDRGTETSQPDTGGDGGTEGPREVAGRVADGRPEPVVATRSADDSDVGWGDRETGSNDDRLHQDKPPHW